MRRGLGRSLLPGMLPDESQNGSYPLASALNGWVSVPLGAVFSFVGFVTYGRMLLATVARSSERPLSYCLSIGK